MKKAVLYARVSSEEQRKLGTIESQIFELRRQIIGKGDILVKEYADNGYSGALLDRPALNDLRADLKTDLFDVIYFLNTDRIARDVTYQNLIIAEILKYEKQIIINGRDYVENPENKFTLTVLGAVSELERAKIIERSQRGRQMKLKQGQLMSNGCNTYGYDYIPKTMNTSGHLVINEKEAEVVRLVFTEYAKPESSLNQITKYLEEKGYRTKTGKRYWSRCSLKVLLSNTAYYGVKYFNKTTKIKVEDEHSDKLIKSVKTKEVKRDPSEWAEVKVPAIISKELFDKVQARLKWNKKNYRNPGKPFLLTSLVSCGVCGSGFTGYRRTTKKQHKYKKSEYRIEAYRCIQRIRQNRHSVHAEMTRCDNKQVVTHALEERVFSIIENVMLIPERLMRHIEIFKQNAQTTQLELDIKLREIDRKIQAIEHKKKRILDLYAGSHLSKDNYVKKNNEYETDLVGLKKQRMGTINSMPALHKPEVIDQSIKNFCERAKEKLKKCSDIKSKRQFLLEFINKIVYKYDDITIRGFIPVGIKPEFSQFNERCICENY